MKKIVIFILVCCSVFTTAFSQSQMSMNEDAQVEYKKSENEINAVYQRVLKSYSSETEFIKKLKIAQRLWIQFRDAEVEAKYPEAREAYGSVYSMCAYSYLTQLTKDRTKTLKIWLIGIPEGDVCAGSVKVKD